ncbi:MAG: class I SAM-dependent methyltransferase, partial [Propionibacteriaceae bacterium]|nr:class I SAM-dependent methyltransferase [Propionibacteriaceae bacterium]
MGAAEFWEERYAGKPKVWSGRVNPGLVEFASGLPAGRALDLGCGEGGDAVWLARQGWQVTAVDISATAVARGHAAAEAAGVPDDRIRWLAQDLAHWQPEGSYDLVSAFFLQSPMELPRGEVLSRAAAAVAPGGHVLVVSHAAPPPWARGHDH